MPATWSVEPGGYIRLVMVGEWSDAADSRAMRDQLFASGHWHADARVLVDLRQAIGATAPQFDDLRQRMASWPGTAEVPARVAVLALPGLTYGIGRVLEGLAAPYSDHLRTFEDEAAALKWLLDASPAP